MRILAIAAFAMGIQLAAAGSALAQSTGTMNGVGHGQGAAKARCSPGDPNVLVDEKTKTYIADTSAMTPQKGSGGVPAPASMTGATGSAPAKTGKSTMVSMCKSEAVSMGAQARPMSK